jgi:hypothetical protein
MSHHAISIQGIFSMMGRSMLLLPTAVVIKNSRSYPTNEISHNEYSSLQEQVAKWI